MARKKADAPKVPARMLPLGSKRVYKGITYEVTRPTHRLYNHERKRWYTVVGTKRWTRVIETITQYRDPSDGQWKPIPDSGLTPGTYYAIRSVTASGHLLQNEVR